ncbi:MAG: tetratricopeptide repeat protein, partial [Alistipes sp.]|nr:tetratricopeptide repeat protein [Alistipes sp.]
MKNYLNRFFILIALLLVGFVARAEEESALETAESTSEEVLPASTEALWDAANTAYINNEYSRAEELYEAILQQGEQSAKLYYNLANACFKQDDLGRAILYYKRALRLSSGDAD